MEARLDRYGRIVLPKDVRDALALEPGDTLVVSKTSEGILLTPSVRSPDAGPLRLTDGVLVFTGTAMGDLVAAVAADRDARIGVLVRVRRHVAARRRRRPAR